MRASAKDRDDCHEVLCDALCWVGVLCLVLDDELDTVAFKQPLDELEAEACEAVAVGNHNSADSSVHASLQKGEQALSLEVKPARDVLERLEVLILRFFEDGGGELLERGCLVGKGTGLLSRRDAGVKKDVMSVVFFFVGGAFDVDAPVSSIGADELELAILAPVPYSSCTHTEVISSLADRKYP